MFPIRSLAAALMNDAWTAFSEFHLRLKEQALTAVLTCNSEYWEYGWWFLSDSGHVKCTIYKRTSIQKLNRKKIKINYGQKHAW